MKLAEAEIHLLEVWKTIQFWRARYEGQLTVGFVLHGTDLSGTEKYEGTIEFQRLARTVRYQDVAESSIEYELHGVHSPIVATTETHSDGRTFWMKTLHPGELAAKTKKMDIVQSCQRFFIPSEVHLTALRKSGRLSCAGAKSISGKDCLLLVLDELRGKEFAYGPVEYNAATAREDRYYDTATGVIVRQDSFTASGELENRTDYETEGIEFVSEAK